METAIIKTEEAKRSHARATGAAYLSYFVVAIVAVLLMSRKIAGGPVVDALADVLYAATTLLFYRLFRRVDAVLAVVATLFSLAGCAIDILHQFHRGPANLSPLVFFGPFCVLLGILIVRSRFLPRWPGWPLIVAGLAWLAFLIPAVALRAEWAIFPVGFLAEFALMLWLVVKGVNEARWQEIQR
jgi:hypothetical protein